MGKHGFLYVGPPLTLPLFVYVGATTRVFAQPALLTPLVKVRLLNTLALRWDQQFVVKLQ